MMQKNTFHIFRFTLILCASLIAVPSFAAHTFSPPSVKKDTAKKKDTTGKQLVNTEFVLKPVIGLGAGMLSYFGNVNAPYSKLQNPMTSRNGFDLQYSQKLNPVMEFNLYALFGSLSVNTRSPKLNWNFNSSIAGGGLRLMFKLLPKQTITPYILTGVESFEFLTKTSIYDYKGNTYYYWNDGSIRSLPQTSPMASTATILNWDYVYATDMRNLNIGNTGKYETQTFAIPVGLGLMFHLTKRVDFLVSSTLHYTFTNHIDGLGDSIGGTKHDIFLMNSIALRIDITSSKRNKELIEERQLENKYSHPDDYYAGVDFDALAIDTIKPVVDNSKPLSDSAMLRQYQEYMDSTGAFAKVVVENNIGTAIKKNNVPPQQQQARYSVQLGRFNKGVPPDVMDKLLSIPNVKSEMMPDSSTAYYVGDFTDLGQAQSSQQQFIQNGIPDAKVVSHKGNELEVVNNPVNNNQQNNNQQVNNNQQNNNQQNNNQQNNQQVNNNQQQNNNQQTNVTPNLTQGVIVYRVQLGAYSHKLPRDVFMNVDNIVEVKAENGFFTYSAGSFTSFQEAVNYKTQLIALGYQNLFIKAYQNGKRVALDKAGATYVKPEKEDLNEEVTHVSSTLDKSHVSFGVQVGVFKGTPPKNLAEKYKQLSNVYTVLDTATGLTHYLVGPYTKIDDAREMKKKLSSDPLLKDSFIGAYYNNKSIPVAQALDLLKQ